MKRIIFLDFDGVLNSARWMVSQSMQKHSRTSLLQRSLDEIDPAAVKLISDLAVETKSGIIISSSWRLLHPLYELCNILEYCGMDPSVLPHGVTPHSRNAFRGDEVREWLEQNPGVHTHVIFDDDSDFHPDQPLVQTSWDKGLLPEHIWKAEKILLNTD